MQTEKAVCQNTKKVELIIISSFYASQKQNISTASKLEFETALCYLHVWSFNAIIRLTKCNQNQKGLCAGPQVDDFL